MALLRVMVEVDANQVGKSCRRRRIKSGGVKGKARTGTLIGL
jgi:hypothetical protein